MTDWSMYYVFQKDGALSKVDREHIYKHYSEGKLWHLIAGGYSANEMLGKIEDIRPSIPKSKIIVTRTLYSTGGKGVYPYWEAYEVKLYVPKERVVKRKKSTPKRKPNKK
jgi:hypothetical protein